MFRSRFAGLQVLLFLAMLMPVGPQAAWSDDALSTPAVGETDPAQDKPADDDGKSAYTDDVMRIAYSFPDGGGYIWKNSTGACETLTHKGQTILKKQPKGTYCCGFTLQVAFKLAEEKGLFDDKSAEQVRGFQKRWYGTTEDSGEKQCTVAMQALGVGHAVSLDDAKRGDFGNFWRTKSGHSIIFLNWVTDDDGHRIGIHYRSSQTSTDGIGDHTEYFKGHDGHVDLARIYLCRFNEPAESDAEAKERGANR